MTGFKIYQEGVRTRKHVYELTEEEIRAEIGDWLVNNIDVDDEDFETWEKMASEKEAAIIEEAKSEYGFDMGDYTIYLRQEGCDYKGSEIILTDYNNRPCYMVVINDEYVLNKYEQEHFSTIEEAYEVADENLIPTINQLTEIYGLTLRQISDRFSIPYRTVQNWNSEQRECPKYILKMMCEILSNESE